MTPQKRQQSQTDINLCKTGSTARILFMTHDTTNLYLNTKKHNNYLNGNGNGGMFSLFGNKNRNKKKGKHNRLHFEKPKYGKNNNKPKPKPRPRRNMNVTGGIDDTLVLPYCGTSCAMNTAIENYYDQLNAALWDSNIMISRISVSSKPYRSSSETKLSNKSSSNSNSNNNKESEASIALKAEEINSAERKWVDLDLAESTSTTTTTNGKNSGNSNSDNGNKSQTKQFINKRKNPLIIDSKYSLEANQAAHAILSSRPKQWYDNHQNPVKPRAKFLGL